ncbi:hypothetical protein Hanom_Chr14g01333451 [Helianthus anomalus]
MRYFDLFIIIFLLSCGYFDTYKRSPKEFFYTCSIYVCFDSNECSEETSIKLCSRKRGFLRFCPPAESIHLSAHFLKYFNWYTQEIGQFSSFLFHFPRSKILISTSQWNGSLASDIHIKDTPSINTLFNFYSDGLNIFYKKSEKDPTIFSRKSPTKDTHYSVFYIKSIITTTYIPRNCAPQIGANKKTRDPIERHHNSLWKKNDFLRRK